MTFVICYQNVLTKNDELRGTSNHEIWLIQAKQNKLTTPIQTRLSGFGVTAILSWGWLKLRLIEDEVDCSWSWLKLRLIEVEVDCSWG